MREKNLPSIQFVITDRMSLLSPLSSNGRSIPLIKIFPLSASSALFKKISERSAYVPDPGQERGRGVSTGHLFLHCPGRG